MSRRAAEHGPLRKVLISIEDDELARLAMLTLKHGPYDCRRVDAYAALPAAITEFAPHLVLLDIDDAGGTANQSAKAVGWNLTANTSAGKLLSAGGGSPGAAAGAGER